MMRPKRQPKSPIRFTLAPSAVARCNLEASSYRPKGGLHLESQECTLETALSGAPSRVIGAPGFGFSKSKTDQVEVLNSDWRFI